MKHTIALILIKLSVVAEILLVAGVFFFGLLQLETDPVIAGIVAIAGTAVIFIRDPREYRARAIMKFPISYYLKPRRQKPPRN